MELKVSFYNRDIPPVHFQSESPTSKVFEIRPIGGSRQRRHEVSARYLTELDYALKGVTNITDEYISELFIEVPSLDIKVFKNNKAVGKKIIEDESIKYKTIIYDIAPGIVSENLYVTKGGQQHSLTYRKGSITSEDIRMAISDHLNTDIITRTKDNAITVDIAILMAIVEKYIKGYSLKWNSSINAFQIVERGKSYITYNQIRADDTYTFFRLLGLILDKGKHNGVFYIRADSYRKEVLDAMLKMIELLYKNQYIVFLYNADITCKRIEKEVIELPNYLVMGGKMNVR